MNSTLRLRAVARLLIAWPCLITTAHAAPAIERIFGDRRVPVEGPLLLAVDEDDSDEDDTADSQQTERIPSSDLAQLALRPDPGRDAVVSVVGDVRLLEAGRPLASTRSIAAGREPTALALQATHPATRTRPAALIVQQGAERKRIAIHAVALEFLDADNRRIDASQSALRIAERITNDGSLPRSFDFDARSPEPSDIRIQVFDAFAPGKRVHAKLVVLSDDLRARRSLVVPLARSEPDSAFRSRFIRLVGDDVDETAPGLAGQVLRVGLRDRVRVVYETSEGTVQQELRVGRPGDERGPLAARAATLRVTVLRAGADGQPVIGGDDLTAIRVVQDELGSANEIWLQCQISLGRPAETSVQIADPPPATLLSVADGDGLPARGGTIRLRVDGRALRPILIAEGTTPEATALRIEERLRAEGYHADVTVNPRTLFGAGRSADVLVRRSDGAFVTLEAPRDAPISTDPQQRIAIGVVDLSDGLEEFDNLTAQSGTLEERTLIKALSDDDPATIDVFIINRFTHGTRQGEAFIPASAGAILNTVVLDRSGLRQRKTAWTLAHELGHVLLNQPLHPDNIGNDAPMLLMDSDNNRGTVNGPKRLLPAECARARYEAEVQAYPPLLRPYEPRLNRAATPSEDAPAQRPD